MVRLLATIWLMTGNPFATPSADAYSTASEMLPSSGEEIWRAGTTIVMGRHARLPDFCIKTGAPATRRLNRKLYWHHPAVYLALLINVIVFAIVAFAVRKSVAIEIPLSEEAVRARSKWIWMGWGMGLGGIGLVFGALVGEYFGLILVGLVVFLFGVSVGRIGSRLLWPSKIDDHYVYLKGAKEPFLSHLSPQSKLSA